MKKRPDLAKFGNLWHSVPNGIFVKGQCWRGLAYRFAQIYLAKNFYRRKRKRGGLVPPPWFFLVTPSNRPARRVHDFRRSDRLLDVGGRSEMPERAQRDTARFMMGVSESGNPRGVWLSRVSMNDFY
ncbi:TPA: hypothetical protein G9F27_004292 [Salmonella enterica]|uniref:Uncharacterized protein n=1 Tax=Salmonella enterica TaxID=28901 RepID=A0A743P328_SALER|nr:hypothetical protein [Salmonella enterica]